MKFYTNYGHVEGSVHFKLMEMHCGNQKSKEPLATLVSSSIVHCGYRYRISGFEKTSSELINWLIISLLNVA